MIAPSVYAETLLGFLEPVRKFLDDPSVSEIMINGPSVVFIERRGQLEATDARFESREAILCALRNAAQFVGKHVDELHPILEARMPDGSRLQAVIPPAAPDGPYVSIRRFSKDSFSLSRLLDLGTLTQDAHDSLDAMVHSKLNVMIAGGTGSGKTSLLNAFTHFIPRGERIAVIEDSKEVQVQHPHVVQLEARPADPQGRGAVSIRDLFRATLRMRPDRIVIGEIRGGEALDIIQAMVSGHGGCLGTLHATYPRDTLTRLETMAMMSDVELPLAALRLQIASGVNVIVQVSRLSDGSRKLTHITEVAGFDMHSGRYELHDIFARQYYGQDSHGRIQSDLLPTGYVPSFVSMLRDHGKDLPAAVYDAAERRIAGQAPQESKP
ncbi:MAG: Type secretion system hydrolase TadA/VirB11/CpaF, TadA subfamily [Polyangiaceae bacterium]|nr:Type secretion system hydrolase TadA/VirB11/CpaF, TadA subfamily [Polyangiaceae bacterium]